MGHSAFVSFYAMASQALFTPHSFYYGYQDISRQIPRCYGYADMLYSRELRHGLAGQGNITIRRCHADRYVYRSSTSTPVTAIGSLRRLN